MRTGLEQLEREYLVGDRLAQFVQVFLDERHVLFADVVARLLQLHINITGIALFEKRTLDNRLNLREHKYSYRYD